RRCVRLRADLRAAARRATPSDRYPGHHRERGDGGGDRHLARRETRGSRVEASLAVRADDRAARAGVRTVRGFRHIAPEIRRAGRSHRLQSPGRGIGVRGPARARGGELVPQARRRALRHLARGDQPRGRVGRRVAPASRARERSLARAAIQEGVCLMRARLAADIGGTFTDVVLENPAGRDSAKGLTTAAPETGVLDGVRRVLAAGLPPSEVSVFVHGTTLATNALIERKGARTAFVTTEGMRDIVEMGYEKRFEQYDVYMERPLPLVPRPLRFTVPGRLDGRGR